MASLSSPACSCNASSRANQIKPRTPHLVHLNSSVAHKSSADTLCVARNTVAYSFSPCTQTLYNGVREQRNLLVRCLPAKEPFPDAAAVPWQFGFQCNERYLQWEDAAQQQLVKIYLAQKLDIPPEEVDERMEALANILPDMVGRLQRTRADLLLRMMSDMQGLVGKLMGLKALLPKCNVSLMVSRYPYLLLEYSVQDVETTLNNMRLQLPGVDVEELLEREPLLLRANIEQLLADIKRLLPSGDPVALLVSNPQMVLDMHTGNMPSSEDMVTV